ncbi:MAG: hypothetical protein WBM43_12845 [Flavobacteriaceae bacterium]
MNEQQIIDWLLEGDVSIQYQVFRDLLDKQKPELQERIAHEGWGKRLLSERKANGHWGDRFYQPKWTSTHYTLLDLRNLNLHPQNDIVKATIDQVLESGKAEDGGIRLGPSTSHHSDVCVNGMFLNYSSYFKTHEKKLHSIVDSILEEIMPDGGFNCRTIRSGATHSSLHSTISVLEGLGEFRNTGSAYRSEDIDRAIKTAEEFVLMHKLFISDRTGEIINKNFLKLTYPCRWKYDILRALDYFQYVGHQWDDRMYKTIKVLVEKQKSTGTWTMQAAHPGQVYFTMEKAGKPSRWNTLRVLRVLKQFKDEYSQQAA